MIKGMEKQNSRAENLKIFQQRQTMRRHKTQLHGPALIEMLVMGLSPDHFLQPCHFGTFPATSEHAVLGQAVVRVSSMPMQSVLLRETATVVVPRAKYRYVRAHRQWRRRCHANRWLQLITHCQEWNKVRRRISYGWYVGGRSGLSSKETASREDDNLPRSWT